MENNKTDQRIYRAGVITIVIMALSYFVMALYKHVFLDVYDGLVSLYYIVAVIFFVIIVARGVYRRRQGNRKRNKDLYGVLLGMLCMSAYALNHNINVFNTFTTWTEVAMFVILIPTTFGGFYHLLHPIFKWLFAAINGFGLVLATYFALFLLPVMPAGTIGLIFLGLGIHAYTPLLLVLRIIIDFKRFIGSRESRIAFSIGAGTPVIILIAFLMSWKDVRINLHNSHATVVTNPNNELPNWILLSQQLEDNVFNTYLLQGGVNCVIPNNRRSGFFGFSGSKFSTLKHDPLIYVAFLIFGDLPITEDEKLKILNAKYTSRHGTEPRLWSGENLKTVEVLNNISIHPKYRLAYTEKTITIQNDNPHYWPTQEEAYYSFHVPEGSVVTSLSLWVEGVERKSKLSTKQKATSAYANIVGVQRRDPAIAHWQEGNRITVNVFPCTKQENRMFKIGLTTPLTVANNKLIYENFYFEGPEIKNAMETTIIKIEGEQNIPLQLPSGYDQIGVNKHQYTGSYQPHLFVTMDVQEINSTPFCFGGSCYQMAEQNKKEEKASFDNVYIDVNSTLYEFEFESILNAAAGKKVFVYTTEMIEVTESNKKGLFKELSRFQFSLFPFHHMKTENNLLITKSSGLEPNLKDLEQSKFKENMNTYLMQQQKKTKVYSLNKLSDYMSSMNQLQLIDVHYGIAQNVDQVFSGTFPSKTNNDDTVYIDNSHVQIEKFPGNQSSDAPDHVLRLFAYSQIMKKIGPHYYEKEKHEDELFSIANEAFILSPISSMIVLETEKDYEDNDISNNKNSLKNASINSSGAVPEPHEWALIGLAFLTLAYLYKKKTSPTIG